MTDTTEATTKLNLKIGMPVDSSDHHWGVVDDIVIDPTHWKVTHIVVQPRFRHHKARLIPIEAIDQCDGRLRLSWTTKQILAAAKVETTDFIRYNGNGSSNPVNRLGYSTALAWPYYTAIGAGAVRGYGYGYGWGAGYGLSAPAVVTTTYDHVPSGTVEIRRGSEVVTTDHQVVGHVDGFVTDADGAITHLVLGHGHLWAHREISIPLADVQDAASDEVRLSVTKDEVENYPTANFQRP